MKTNKALNLREARELTDKIDTSQDAHWALLYEAKLRKAWIPLGYASFGEYVTAELGMKRSQAYNLLKAYAIKNEILAHLANGVDLPDVGSTILIDVTKEEAPEIANELNRRKRLNGGLDSQTAKQVIRERRSRSRQNPESETSEDDVEVEDYRPGRELSPYFRVLWDAVTILEESTTDEDLYRGFKPLVATYDRLHLLLERLEDGAEAFLAENPEFIL